MLLLGLFGKGLSSVDEAALRVATAVYKVGVVEGELDSAVHDVVHSLDERLSPLTDCCRLQLDWNWGVPSVRWCGSNLPCFACRSLG